MPAVTRILAVGAMAGNETVWRKFVNTLALDVYKIDAAVVLGPLGVDHTEARRWRALADERLADSPIGLTLAGAEAVVDLPGGRPLPVAVDEAAVRVAVARLTSALALCGGEAATAPRKFWIDGTLCLDPGSDAGRGGLCGYVADLGARGVRVAQPLRT